MVAQVASKSDKIAAKDEFVEGGGGSGASKRRAQNYNEISELENAY